MLENFLSIFLDVAHCNSENSSENHTLPIKLPGGHWALPVTLTLAGAKIIPHLPPKDRLAGLTLIIGVQA